MEKDSQYSQVAQQLKTTGLVSVYDKETEKAFKNAIICEISLLVIS